MQLSKHPVHYPDCCIAISERLIQVLAKVLPNAPLWTLSIGSGSGLLEAMVLKYTEGKTDIRGVEVSPNVNKHLPESHMYSVTGTWALSTQADSASAWLLVYPREPRLVSLYIESYRKSPIDCIVWLGPRSDWQDYEPVFLSSPFNAVSIEQDCGSAEYEIMAIARRSHESS